MRKLIHKRKVVISEYPTEQNAKDDILIMSRAGYNYDEIVKKGNKYVIEFYTDVW